MKKIKLLFKTINYLGSEASTTLKSSLAHTLRIEENETAFSNTNMKWDSAQVAANQIWIGDSFVAHDLGLAINSLLDFGTFISQETNAKFIDSILKNYQQPACKARQTRELASAKSRLKNAGKVIEIDGLEKARAMLDRYLKDGTNFDELRTIFDELPLEFRAKKLGKKLEYLQSRRKLQQRYPCRKSTIVQEGILTFPVKDPITVGFSKLENELTSVDLIFAMKSFLEKYYGEFPIIAIVAHVDEVRLHIHYFIDGWSKGLLPMTIPQKTFETFLPVSSEAKSNNAVSNKVDLKRAGANFQACFYEHINSVLLDRKGIQAGVSPLDERTSAEAKQRNLDAKKPIAMREYQRVNEQIRELKIQQEALNKSNEELQLSMATLVQQSAILSEELTENANIILEQQKIINVLDGESVSEFVYTLKEAFKSASSYTFTTDLEVKVALLLKRYPLLQRDFWQDLLRLGLGANLLNYDVNDNLTNNN